MLTDDSSRCWGHTVRLLDTSHIVPPTRSHSPVKLEQRRSKMRSSTSSTVCAVRVIDRPSPTIAIVAWSDPTLCCYGDQTWQAGVARRAGICAASGKPIRRGTEVYKPRCKPMPANAYAMILATVVQSAALAASI